MKENIYCTDDVLLKLLLVMDSEYDDDDDGAVMFIKMTVISQLPIFLNIQ